LEAVLAKFVLQGVIVVVGSLGDEGPDVDQSEPAVAPFATFDVAAVL